MELYQGYWSVIPAHIRRDESLSANAKLLFSELSSLAQADGYCWARNAHFVSSLGVSERTVIRLLKELSEHGHIRTVILRDEKTGQVMGRRIFPFWNPPTMPEASESEAPISNVTSQDSAENTDVLQDGKCHVSPPDKNDRWPPDKNGTTLLTKMSGGNNNVENIIIKNKPPIVPREKAVKKQPDEAARAELRAWIDSMTELPVTLHGELADAIMSFCDMRCDNKKPLRAGRAVTQLKKRLVEHSNNRADIMIEILNESVFRGWDSVYPQKEDTYSRQNQENNQAKGKKQKWI